MMRQGQPRSLDIAKIKTKQQSAQEHNMIRKTLYSLSFGVALVLFASPPEVSAQAMNSVEPFKVGTFADSRLPSAAESISGTRLRTISR